LNSVQYIFFICLLSLDFLLATNLNWSAETRLKVENYHNDTTYTSATASYFRGRINFDLTSNIYRVFFQLQDSRLLGGQNNSAGQTGLNETLVTFHQFYGQVNGHLAVKIKYDSAGLNSLLETRDYLPEAIGAIMVGVLRG